MPQVPYCTDPRYPMYDWLSHILTNSLLVLFMRFDALLVEFKAYNVPFVDFKAYNTLLEGYKLDSVA